MGVPASFQSQLGPSLTVLDGGARDYDALLERIGDARYVLLGEASHGTHEFYRERARITQRLIVDLGFDAVALEADFPDAHRVHRYVRGAGDDADAEQSLRGFARFPTWMWRNADVLTFVAWLREHRERTMRDVGFYGLDLYSLYASIEAVIGYLERVDPAAAARARARYACFEQFGEDTTAYAYAAGLDVGESCEREATAQLLEMRARAFERARADGEELFGAERNAALVKDAEEYYRSMFRGAATTWNLRDRHMADTLAAVAQHLDHRLGRPCRIAVWAHNSHLGDARATDMGRAGELNVGQLLRERYGRDAFLLGMTTYDGTVTAASDWDGPAERKHIRPALEGSYEAELHALGVPRFLILPDGSGRLPAVLRRERLERAIGVIYRPETERVSHWFHARMCTGSA